MGFPLRLLSSMATSKPVQQVLSEPDWMQPMGVSEIRALTPLNLCSCQFLWGLSTQHD